MGYHRNRLDEPVNFFYSFFIFGPARRRGPQKTVISGIEPKPELWGINGIVSMRPSNFCDIFCTFGLTRRPRTTPKGPGAPPDTVISGIEPKPINWESMESSRCTHQNFWFFCIFSLISCHRTPQKGLSMPSPPKTVIYGIQPKPGMWAVIGIISVPPSNFLNFFAFSASPVICRYKLKPAEHKFIGIVSIHPPIILSLEHSTLPAVSWGSLLWVAVVPHKVP